MAISTDLIKDLRERTGAGMMDCKKALEQNKGDIDEAIKFLREKGLASAAKKSGRATKEGLVTSYIHGNGKIGVMVEVNCETDFVARNEKFQQMVKDIAMHIAAMNPRFVSGDDVPEDIKEEERKIYRVQAKETGKPDNVIEKIVEGKIKKFCKEVCLLDQAFVKNPDATIGDYIKENISTIGENISVRRFVRWQLGEN
ncbi:MAG: translation elongation factor Ts [Oligoflexia bacterium]|nr:translation elongation factor Ts [Oligoflexia bacterium]